MNIILGIVIGLLVLMALVIAHELGHFIAARKNGVKVNEFGIGFPPRAIAWVKNPEYEKWQKTTGVNRAQEAVKNSEKNAKKPKKWLRLPKSEWDKPQKTLILSINWLPIGGFCALDGESGSDTRKGTFGASSFWTKTKILFAGVGMNWLVAAVILTILAVTGMPQFLNDQFYLGQDAERIGGGVVVAEVMEDTPAAAAGLQSGDTILAINDNNILQASDVININQANAGQEVNYDILRDGKVQELNVSLNSANDEYILGVAMSHSQTYIRSTWSAPIVGIGTTIQMTGETFRALGDMCWNLISGAAQQFSPDDAVRQQGQEAIGAAGDSVSGPVGILGVIFPAFADSGVSNLAFLAALISVSLACMNVLPIPALDGGRWLLFAIYKVRKKTLDKATEERIVSRAFIFLFLLIILITALDIIKLF